MEGKLWRITVQDPNTLGLKQQELKPKRWVSVQRTQICPKPLGFPPSIRGYNGDHWIPNSSFPFLLASAPRLTCRMQAMPGADGASSCKSTTPFRWTWKLQQRRRLPGQRWNDVLGVAGWILHRRYAHLCKIVVGSWGSCLPNDGILMTNKWKGRFRGSTADPRASIPCVLHESLAPLWRSTYEKPLHRNGLDMGTFHPRAPCASGNGDSATQPTIARRKFAPGAKWVVLDTLCTVPQTSTVCAWTGQKFWTILNQSTQMCHQIILSSRQTISMFYLGVLLSVL